MRPSSTPLTSASWRPCLAEATARGLGIRVGHHRPRRARAGHHGARTRDAIPHRGARPRGKAPRAHRVRSSEARSSSGDGRQTLCPRPSGVADDSQRATGRTPERQPARGEEAGRQLSASRSRIVAAEAAARRQIERDIHDGAQQDLVALIARIGLARNQLGTDTTSAGSRPRRAPGGSPRHVDQPASPRVGHPSDRASPTMDSSRR